MPDSLLDLSLHADDLESRRYPVALRAPLGEEHYLSPIRGPHRRRIVAVVFRQPSRLTPINRDYVDILEPYEPPEYAEEAELADTLAP